MLQLGPIRVRWYGVMYLLGFLIGRVILRGRASRGLLPLSKDRIDDFLIALFVGMLVGARMFYMVFYYVPPPDRGASLLNYFAVWEGGLSFHGALIGMVAAIGLFAWKSGTSMTSLLDGLVAAAPPGLFLGRIGNFINAELYGRAWDGPWAMKFPIRDWDGNILDWTEPRHPSQLYQGVTEGLMAWALLTVVARYLPRQGMLFSIGLTWYGFARFFVEFFREKDPQLPFYFGWMTMGQILCVVMFITGASCFFWFRKNGPPVAVQLVEPSLSQSPSPGSTPPASKP